MFNQESVVIVAVDSRHLLTLLISHLEDESDLFAMKIRFTPLIGDIPLAFQPSGPPASGITETWRYGAARDQEDSPARPGRLLRSDKNIGVSGPTQVPWYLAPLRVDPERRTLVEQWRALFHCLVRVFGCPRNSCLRRRTNAEGCELQHYLGCALLW